MFWNDRRTPPNQLTDVATGKPSRPPGTTRRVYRTFSGDEVRIRKEPVGWPMKGKVKVLVDSKTGEPFLRRGGDYQRRLSGFRP